MSAQPSSIICFSVLQHSSLWEGNFGSDDGPILYQYRYKFTPTAHNSTTKLPHVQLMN